MEENSDTVRELRARVAALGEGAWILAVSGGADSMVLLDAAAASLDRSSLIVATFDHGTGDFARRAVSAVVQRAGSLHLPTVTGTAPRQGTTESEWRAHRWNFLRAVARKAGADARVVTAHTRDDQLETVVMRTLRGAGARGLAALYASSSVARPLIGQGRDEILKYARQLGITFVTDPSNAYRKHLRNRVRLDLLPALEAAHPGFGSEMIELSKKAALWRAQMEAVAFTFPMVTDRDTHSFERAPLRALSEPSLRTLWPSLAARADVVLDWRGTERLATFTIEGANKGRIQLAGGVEVCLLDGSLVFARIGRHDR